MKKLIELDAAIKETWKDTGYTDPLNVMTAIRDRLESLPSVDAVEVVRCRECRWCNMGECEHKFGLLVSNDENYCSYGERDVDI